MFTPFHPLCRAALACLLLASLLATTGPARASEGLLRIRVLEQQRPEQVEIESPHSALLIFEGNDRRPLHRLQPGQRAFLQVRNGVVSLSLPDGGQVKARDLRLLPDAGAAFTLRALGTQRTARSYMGSLRVSVDGQVLKLVNHVDLEAYVASVITSEYGLDDLEGSKAMAVIIRTYALQALGKQGEYDHVDHTLSQVYRGAGHVSAIAREAARLTRGQVLTYQGRLIEAVYSSSSGGHTANNEHVWRANAAPYLRGKPDPYDTVSPHRAWRTAVPKAKLLRALSDAFGFRVADLRVAARNADGRAQEIELVRDGGRSRSLAANEFRLFFMKHFGATSLKSTLFSIKTTRSEYVFEGRGFGHGVGLSQWGAHGMAQRGIGYQEILGFYYTGVTLESGDERVTFGQVVPTPSPATPPPAVATTPIATPSPAVTTAPPPAPPPAPKAKKKSRPRVGW